MKMLTTFIILSIILFTSCEKNSDNTSFEINDIANIKESFLRTSVADNHTLWGASHKRIDWDDPHSIKRDSSATYIRVHINDTVRFGLQKISQGQYYQIWLKATKNKNTDGEYALSYLTLLTSKPSTDFTGLIFLENITDKFSSYSSFAEGKAMNPIRRGNAPNVNTDNRMSAWREECQTVWAIVNDVYKERQTCRMVFDSSFLGAVDQIGTGDWNFGGSGGGGIPPSSTYKITNKITAPCLKKMVDELIDKDIVFRANLSLKSIFGLDGKYDLVFDQTTSLPNSIHGTASTKGGYWDNGSIEGLTVEINLNVTTLSGASQEYIAMVVLHESIHAYLYAQGFVEDLTKIHHEQMWLNYTDFIAKYLTDTYGTQPADAYAMATVGLQQTFGSRISETIYNKITGYKGDLSEDRAIEAEKYRKGEKGTSCTSN